MVIETWKNIPDYDGVYQISDVGSVKSLKGNTKILTQSVNGAGYLQVGLYKNGKETKCRTHQLVAIAFLDHIPNGNTLVVDHINHNRLDNNLTNLRITTHRENANKAHLKSSSKYIGVGWCERRNRWRSRITIGAKDVHLGYFKTEIEASIVYQEKLKEIK